VLAWRNSLVFHSLDKTTSLFIHLTPNILLYALRWLDEDPDRCVYDSLEPDSCACVQQLTSCRGVCDSLATYETLRGKDATFTQMVFLPIIPYLIWQVLYLIKVQGRHHSVRLLTFAYQLIRLIT
jgi:hypothetical protein